MQSSGNQLPAQLQVNVAVCLQTELIDPTIEDRICWNEEHNEVFSCRWQTMFNVNADDQNFANFLCKKQTDRLKIKH